ncbi:hypothetical protein PWT90_11148 [Aphanocladium album]|nr:hypothetical protein PWT90_11148 [Aphanocladium album]
MGRLDQACVAAESCQDRIFEIISSSAIWVYSLITKAAVEMISPSGGTSVIGKDNKINYCDIIMAWMGSAGGDVGSGGAIHRSPASATVIPFPATSVAPTQTFTIAGPVVSQIDFTYNEGNQNLPPGPGSRVCMRCDLCRLITSTCCGVQGGVSNPIEIGARVPIPRPMFLPPGFIPNQPVTDKNGATFAAGQPLSQEILVPIGAIFPVPFLIPPGLPLSDTWSPDARNNTGNRTLYLIPGFWNGPHTIKCQFPCTIVFPPMTTSTSWSPPPITIGSDPTKTTTTIPPYTTELIKISRTTVETQKSQPTQTIYPKPGRKPLCFKLPIVKIRICPPAFKVFPPPVPPVTILPIPPGGKPEPTNTNNEPTPEEEQEEEEDDDEEEEESLCMAGPYSDDSDGADGAGDDSYPGAGTDNTPDDYQTPGAGIGRPSTSIITATKTVTVTPTVTVTNDVTITVAPTDYYKFTSTRGSGDTVVCQSSGVIDFFGEKISTCEGERSVIPRTTTSEPPPPPPPPAQTIAWGWFQKVTITPSCGLKCRADFSLSAYALPIDNPCHAHSGYQAKDKDGFFGYGMYGEKMTFANGVCGSPKPYICSNPQPDTVDTWKCLDESGDTLSTCELTNRNAFDWHSTVCDPNPLSGITYKLVFRCATSFSSINCW